MRTVSPASVWCIARDKLDRARRANWSDVAKAEEAWADVTATEQKLLVPAKHMTDLVEKLSYLLDLSNIPGMRHQSSARPPWKVRLLQSVIKDALRLADQVEQNQRCESLRQHAARLGEQGELAAQLADAKRELSQIKAERDAAHAALERANSALPRARMIMEGHDRV